MLYLVIYIVVPIPLVTLSLQVIDMFSISSANESSWWSRLDMA
jgi:hypothetical protein